MLHNGIDCQSGAPDVSLAATPASDDVRNAAQILGGAQAEVALLFEPDSCLAQDLGAVARLLRHALSKLEQGAK